MEWLSLPHRGSKDIDGKLTPAWDTVAARKDEEKRVKDNQFRLDHPHLAEWREVGSPREASQSSLAARETALPPIPLPPL
jgi:hypothetical protein